MPATSSVVGSRAELATLPWLLLVHLCVSAGAFKFGVDREEPFVKFLSFTLGPSKCKAKLRIFQISAFEIYVERLKETPTRSSKEVAQAANQRGEECIEGNLFFLHWPETAGTGFWGGSAHVTIKRNGWF